MSIEIKQAAPGQSPAIAEMVGELLEEIMNGIGESVSRAGASSRWPCDVPA